MKKFIEEHVLNTVTKKNGWGAQGSDEDTYIKKNGWGSIGFRRTHCFPGKNGWGGRIRTHGWRDQNPLPYRLATPQSSFGLFKNTTRKPFLLLLLSIFLFLLSIRDPVQAIEPSSITESFNSRTLILQNLGNSIEFAKFFKDQIIYSSKGQVYLGLDQINLLKSANDNSSNGNFLKINNIVIDDEDFYLATDIGIFKNYSRIFQREECFHIEKSPSKIFISCVSGIYQAQHNPKNPHENYIWKSYEASPASVNFFTLNRSRSNPEFASSANGFYYYDARKHTWFRRNQGISRDFNESYGFGRFLVERISKDLNRIYLPSSIGLLVSNDNGKTWVKNNSALSTEASGFHVLREIKTFHNNLLLASSTGLYISPINASPLNWQKISISKIRKDQNLNENIYSIDTKYPKSKNKADQVIISNSEGQVISLEENLALTLLNSTNTLTNNLQDQELAIPQINNTLEANVIKKENHNLISTILACEPKVQELHKIALEFTGIPSGKNFQSYRRQARLRNILPEFETFANKGIQNYISIESSGKDSFTSSNSGISTSQDQVNVDRDDNQIDTGMKLSWNLGNIIYDPEINDINTSARVTANIRENILNEITQIYFTRRELLYRILNTVLETNEEDPETTSSEIYYQDRIKLEEYTAQLDARTDSWFSTKLEHNFKKLSNSFPESITAKIKEVYFGTSL